MRPQPDASDDVKKLNPGVYPSECTERAENPDGAKSVKADDVSCKDERELHDGLERWLRVHDRRPIPYVHSRTDRKSTVRVGLPDFIVMHGWGARRDTCCAVEFKMPGGVLSEEQVIVIAELEAAAIPVKVCYSVVEAIEFVREKLGL